MARANDYQDHPESRLGDQALSELEWKFWQEFTMESEVELMNNPDIKITKIDGKFVLKQAESSTRSSSASSIWFVRTQTSRTVSRPRITARSSVISFAKLKTMPTTTDGFTTKSRSSACQFRISS
jgi:hypothetical protein